jgi:predicted nucleic acid-binding protein
MRIVIDTNILVSFAIRPTADFERFFDDIAANGVTLVSEDTIAELFAVLSRDKFRSPCRMVCWDFGTGERHGASHRLP